MARVTVEDCTEIVPDRFDLVLLAARRAKQIATGAELTVDRDNDKDSVVALREIAEETINPDTLQEDLVYSFSKRRFYEPKVDPDALEDSSSDDIKEMFANEIAASQLPSDDEPLITPADAEAPAGMSFGDDDVEVED